MESAGPSILIVGLNGHAVRSQDHPQPPGHRQLRVRHMRQNLRYRPFAGRGPLREFLAVDSFGQQSKFCGSCLLHGKTWFSIQVSQEPLRVFRSGLLHKLSPCLNCVETNPTDYMTGSFRSAMRNSHAGLAAKLLQVVLTLHSLLVLPVVILMAFKASPLGEFFGRSLFAMTFLAGLDAG